MRAIFKYPSLLLFWSVALILKYNLENGDIEMEFLNELLAKINEFGTGPAMAVIAMMIEMALRLLKTEKPMSLLIVASGFMKSVGGIFVAASGILDKVIPQRIK